MSEKVTLSTKIKTARVLAILECVLSVLGIAFFALLTLAFIVASTSMPQDADFVDTYAEFATSLGQLGLGADVTPYQAYYWTESIFAMFAGFCALLSIVTLMGSIAVIRAPKNLEKNGYRTFIIAAINIVVAFLSFRLLSTILFAVMAALLNSDYLDRTDKDRTFKNTKHLGAMRVVEIACALELVTEFVVLVFITRSSYFDAIYWVDFVRMLLLAVTLWLLWNRKKHAREIIIVSVAVFLVATFIAQIFLDAFTLENYLLNAILPVAMIIYFATSRRAKAVLVEPWHKTKRNGESREEENLWNPKSLLFWRDLLLFFCIFSVVGHWMEYWVCWLIRLGIVPGEYDPNSGIWHDMLNPFFVYGAAMVFIGLLLYPFKEWLQKKLKNTAATLVVSFVANTVFCAVIELAMGLVLNTPPDPVTGHLPLWDYSTMPFNFMGQICLMNTTFFGLMATLMTWLVYPNLERLFRRLPHDVMNVVSVVVFVFFALVVCMYVINVALPGNLEEVVEVSELA